MGTAILGLNCSVATVSAALGASATGEGEMIQKPTAAMGYAGVMATDTDRVVTVTLEDPLIADSDTVVIFWADGVARDSVQSVTGANDQTIKLSSGGADHEGDALPNDAIAVVIAIETEVTLLIPASQLQALAVSTDERAHISFRKAADALLTNNEHTVLNPYYYMVGLDMTDPVGAFDCITLEVATACITADKVIAIGILYDSA